MNLLRFRLKYLRQTVLCRALFVMLMITCASMVIMLMISWKTKPTSIIQSNESKNSTLPIILDEVTEAKNCFKYRENDAGKSVDSIIFVDDLMNSTITPLPGKSIIFHETSCSTNGLVYLNARQACAIESAAKWNPTRNVFLLFASPVGFVSNNSSSSLATSPPAPIIRALQSYPNIFMRRIDLWKYATDTPVEKWLASEQLFHSKHLIEDVSDFMRLISLYKFGGTYLDLDIIVQKKLDSVEPNFAGATFDNLVNNAAMHFDHNGIGHKIAELCLKDFPLHFDGENYARNGPHLITRVLRRICHTKKLESMTRDRCQGFDVHPTSSFFPIRWENWQLFFNLESANQALEMTKDSVFVHVWNSISVKRKVKVGSKVAYGMIAEKNCPKVYSSCGEYF